MNKIDFTGLGNLPLFPYLDHKPVSSIDERTYEIGEEAARFLFDIIKKEDSIIMRTAQHIQIHCKLVVHKWNILHLKFHQSNVTFS